MTLRAEEVSHVQFRCVLFDVYGTLAEIGERRAPFRKLLRIGELQGRRPSPHDGEAIMAHPLSLRAAADRLGIELAPAAAAALEEDLRVELASVRLFPDTLGALAALRARGVRLGLCSNLAADYARPIVDLLHGRLDAHTWSFEAGAIKPSPVIYAKACDALGCAPSEVLMVGDTVVADVDGPRAFGMQARLLDRKLSLASAGALSSLSEILELDRV
jgi:HAD superfamily hydrolase (TIGR01509 family)